MTIERDSLYKSNRIARYSISMLLVTAIAVSLFSLYLVWTLHWAGPFRDLWEFIPEIENQFQGKWQWHYLIEAYGGAHRIFLPKLLFFADWYWLGGQNLLTIAVSITCQLIYLHLILMNAAKEAVYEQWDKRLIAATFILALFSTTQVSNFLYAMDVQWFMSNLLALSALLTLVNNPEKPLRFIAIGILAALCNFTGLMSIVTGTIWLITQNPRKPTHWGIVLISVIVSGIYVTNPQTTQHVVIQSLHQAEDIQTILHVFAGTIAHIIIYSLRYLASPLSREWPWLGALLSLSAILIIVRYWLLCFQNRLSRFQNLCLLIASTIVLSALATAFGRIIYPNSAIAERYQTLVLPLFPALIGLVLPNLKTIKPFSTITLIPVLFAFYLLPAQLPAASAIEILSNRVQLAHTAARSGAVEMPYVGSTLSHPLATNNINMVKLSDPFLRQNRLGYFNPDREVQIGSAWKSEIGDIPACSQNIQASLDDITQSWTIHGNISIKTLFPERFILVKQSVVVGFGLAVRPEGFLLPLRLLTEDKRFFRAFATLDNAPATSQISLVGQHNNQTVCQQAVLLN